MHQYFQVNREYLIFNYCWPDLTSDWGGEGWSAGHWRWCRLPRAASQTLLKGNLDKVHSYLFLFLRIGSDIENLCKIFCFLQTFCKRQTHLCKQKKKDLNIYKRLCQCDWVMWVTSHFTQSANKSLTIMPISLNKILRTSGDITQKIFTPE